MFASDDDARFVLCGIKVEVKKHKQPVLIATDGRRLVVIESTADLDNLPDESGEFVLRADFIKPICQLSKASGGKLFPLIRMELKKGSKRVNVELLGCKLFVQADDNALVEGKFPEWRQVIPAKGTEIKPVQDIGVNAEHVGEFTKAAKLLGSDEPLISMGFTSQDGVIQVRVSTLSNLYAAIMPCKRSEQPTNYQPSFLNL